MLKIINYKGLILELNANTAIAVERSNSLFNVDDSSGHDLTYPGQAGLTDNNIQFINSGHLVESKNSVYEFDVQVTVSDYQFYNAVFSYKIVKNQIEYLLKVNFGAVFAKLNSAMLNEIYATDAVSGMYGSRSAMEAYMKSTCLLPQDYPCAYFPVYNENWNAEADASSSKWINEWDHAAQKFVVPDSSVSRQKYNMAPFFRLDYIIKKIIEYLKFNTAGNYFNDPSSKEDYIYTRKALIAYQQGPCFDYMPKMSVADFLKYVTDRKKISFDFDLLNNQVIVETPSSALDSNECIDISEYVESIDEKSTAEQKGYTITLKVDESDDAMNIGTGDEQVFKATTSLVVGNGETVVEMEIGTLNQIDLDAYSYPVAKQLFSTANSEEVNDWPLRLIRFKGMKILPDGKLFPEATSLNLSDRDARWYQFLNDSKNVIITAKIPPRIVTTMRPTIKIGCISDKGSFFYALPKKNSYSMSNLNTERITVKIEARILVADYLTKFYINMLDPADEEINNTTKYKAYWNSNVYGFSEVQVKRIPLSGSAAVFGFTPIDSPTDDGGIGGTVGTVYLISGSRADQINSQLRLYSPLAPQYYVSAGHQGFFTKVENYYIFDQITPITAGDGKPVWIVF